MAITCALGFDAQRILYATVYKKMTSLKSGEVFDIMDYMQTVFDKFAENQNKDVAAQFVQQIPYFAGILQFRLPDVDVKLPEGTSLLDLSKKFRDVDNGIPTIMSMFSKETSIKDMVDIANELAISASKTQLGLSDEESEDVRLKARDPFSGTSEQFKEQDPNIKGPEVIDPNKTTIYNTIKAIRASFPSATSFDTINYQGKNLKLRTIILDRIPKQYQTDYTKGLIAQNNAMRLQGTAQENVTPVNEQIAVVIVDDKGKFVLFDEQGNVSEDGTLVYQMVRDVRIENGRYRVTDIYGIEDQILDPVNEALARLFDMGITLDEFESNGNSFEEFVKEVDKEQQESFKQLMNFRKDIVENNKSYDLPINGFSKGVINTALAGDETITLANLDEFYPDLTDNNFKSIQTIDAPTNGFKKGDSIIRLGDAYYKVDRAQMPLSLAEKIADVLTNPKLSAQQKFDFYIQFTNNEVADSVRKFMFTYEKNRFKFFAQPYAKDEAKSLKKQKENDFVEVDLKSTGARQKVIDALQQSYFIIKDQKYEPTRVIYNKDNVDSGLYITGYDENGKAQIGNYFDFIKSLNPEVFTGKAQKTRQRFNPYLKFRLPSEFTDQIAKAEREIEETPVSVEVAQEVEEEEEEVEVLNELTIEDLDNEFTGQNTVSPEDFNFDLDRKVGLPADVTDEEIQAAKDWWENSPLKKYIEIGHMTALVNSNIYAKFIVSGSELLIGEKPLEEGKLARIFVNKAKGGTFVDVYHEAWHAFSQLYLTKEQKRKLYKEYRERFPNLANLRSVEVEERIAEEFREYAKNPKVVKEAPVRNTLFRKILNFLKALFGKISRQDIINTTQGETSYQDELFQKLYFSTKDKNFIADFTPLVDNVRFNDLDRGIAQVGNKQEDALSRQDSLLVSNTIDSILSKIIDDNYKKDKSLDKANKSGVLRILSEPNNKLKAYNIVKQRLQAKANEFRAEAGLPQIKLENGVPTKEQETKFDKIKTRQELRDNAIAVIKSKKGDDKFVFLRSQVDNFDNLNLDTKQGERLKGELYKGRIEIIADFFNHKFIKSKDGEKADIIVVDTVEQAQKQFDNYVEGGATSFTAITFNFVNAAQYAETTPEQSRLLDKIRILETAVANFGDENRGVVKYHIQNSIYDIVRKKFVELEEGEELVMDDPSQKQDYDKNIGGKTLLEFADKEAVYILKSLFKIKDGKTVKNELGFEELAPFRTTWNNVVRTIVGTKSPEEQYKKLVLASAIYPELKQLVEYKLPNPNIENSDTEFKITTSFWQTFKKAKLPFIQLTIFENPNGTYTSSVTNLSLDANRVIRSFNARFKKQVSGEFITRENNITYLNLEKVVQTFMSKEGSINTDKYFDFLNAIGLYLTDMEPIREALTSPANTNKYGVPYIFNVVKEIAKIEKNPSKSSAQLTLLDKFKQNPVRVLIAGIPKETLNSSEPLRQKNTIDNIVGLETEFGTESTSQSIKNPEGNTVNTITEDNELTYIADGLNRATKLSDLWNPEKQDLQYMSYLDPSINPMTEHLQVIKSMFNMTDVLKSKRENRKFEVIMAIGTQLLDKYGVLESGTNTTNLDENSKFLQEFNMFLKGGVQELMRTGSKSSSFGARLLGGYIHPLGKRRNDPNLYVDIDLFANPNSGDNYAFDNILLPYIAGETKRINIYNTQPEAKNYIGYNNPVEFEMVDGKKVITKTAGGSFSAFEDVLLPTTQAEILRLVNSPDINLLDVLEENPQLKQKIREDVRNYFEAITEGIYDFSQEAKYIDPGLLERVSGIVKDRADQERVLVKAYVYNSWIHNFELSHLFAGDIAQFNHWKEELHKRITGPISTGKGFRVDLAAQNAVNRMLDQVSYAQSLGKEYDKFRYNGTLNTAIMQEVIRPSHYLPEIEKGLRADYEERYKKVNPEIRKQLIEDRIKKDLEPYREMKEADGAGYITLDAYRALKQLQNNWSNDQENLYRRIAKGLPVSPADALEFFPVYKLQNYGFISKQEINGRIVNTVLPVTAMHKFALTPLIPSVFKGTDLESLHQQMMKQNIQYVTYESGSKVGAVTSNGKADVIYADAEMKRLKTDIKFTKNIVYPQYIKEAASVNSTYKGKSTNSTQFRKLILEGLFMQGMKKTERLGIAAARYNTAVNSLTGVLKLEMLEELGAVEKNGKYEVDLQQLLKYIRRALNSKDVPQHLLDDIGVTPDNRLKSDLSIHLEARAIERTIMSILEKKFVRQKVNGEPLVQVPGTMTNGLWDNMLRFKDYTADQKQIMNEFLGSNTLSFYTMAKDGKTVRGMGVALTLQGEWLKLLNAKHIDGEVIGTRERLNEMIVNEKWLKENEKAITLTGVRIPVQGYNSMEFARVQYFLDPSAGNMIIPPAEIVAKAGSDFDVDKITAYFPNLSSDGKFIEKTESLAEVKAKVQAKKSGENIKGYLAEVRKSYENELLDSIKSILEMPENYANLVRPNETYILKDIADELEDYILDYNRFNNISVKGYRYQNPKETNPAKRKRRISSTRPLEPRYNLRKHVENLEGKDVLGIIANENSAHPVLTSVGAAMPVSYKYTVYDQAKGKYIEITDLNRATYSVPDTKRIDYTTRLKLNHNTVDLVDRDGKTKPHISLSDMDTADFIDRIADSYSHGMNGTVDVEKDPWIFLIQFNLQISPVLFYLMKAGVPTREAVMFVSNPLIREYAVQQKRIGATYAKLTGYALPKNMAAALKYNAAKNAMIKFAKVAIESKLVSELGKFTTDMVTVDTSTKTKVKIDSYNTADFLELMNTGKLDMNWVKSVYSGEKTPKEIRSNPNEDLVFKFPRPQHEFYYDEASEAYVRAGVEDNQKFELKDLERLTKTDDPAEQASDMSYAMLMHFIEIEKYIRGINTVKRNMKVDTKTFKNPEEALRSDIAYNEAGNDSKVLDGLANRIKDETVLSELFDKKILGTIVENIFPLAHNEVVRNFMQNALTEKLAAINDYFGQGADGQSAFIAEFKDAINDFIYQNFMSNIIDSEGNITTIPDTYRQRQVKINKNQKQDVVYGVERTASGVETKVIYINPDIIDKDYYDQRYLFGYKGTDGYASRDLRPMQAASDPFPRTEADRDESKSQYYRFVLEREYAKITNPFERLVKNKNKDLARIKSALVGGINVQVRDDSQTREAYKAYINQRALLNSFNRAMIMYTPEFSYTNMLENIINEFPQLAETYTVLSQIRPIEVRNTAYDAKKEKEKEEAKEKGEEVRFENEFFNLFTLTDINSLTGQEAEIYQQQLKRLASVNIQKVSDPEDNKRISEIFSLFPLMAVYQHGYGKSMHGVNSILPTADLNAIMEIAKQGFMKNYLNNKSLNMIFDRLTGNNYNNYVVTISDYNASPLEVTAPQAPKLFINELTDEESFIEAQEVSVVKTDGKFTFQDGTEISIPFDLNSEQTNALYQLEKFFNDYQQNINAGAGKSITLTGYAGTGKTTIMSFFNKYLEQKIFNPPTYTSPTNRANAVTKLNNPKAKVLTLHKLFGLREDINLVDGDYDLSDIEFTTNDNNKKISRGDILIVDESSMMNDTLYDMLERAKQELNLAIIYVGDPGQIRPVKQDHVSRVFTDNDVIPLTKVMRTGDNPILKESTDLRNGADFSFVSSEVGGKGVTYINTGTEYQRVLSANLLKMKETSDPLYFRMLFGEGVKDGSISRANDIARKIIFGEESTKSLIPGDLLMGYNNFAENYQTGQPMIINSGDYYVVNVKPTKKRIDEANVTIEGNEVTLQNALDPTQFPINVFIADHTKSLNELIKYADRISEITIESLKHKFTNRRLYGQLYANAKELAKEVAVMVDVMDKNGKLKIHKTLDYGYAHTVHKSQGGTYARTLIMEQKISDTRFDDQLKNQLKYVAMSRATDHVYVFTNKPINEAAAKAKPAQLEPTMPTPPAPTTEVGQPSEYTNHSGGAVGADSMFDQIGKEFGVTEHKHYYYGDKTPLGNVRLTDAQIKEGVAEMYKAAKILNREPKKQATINLLARNWFQVKNSTQVIAIAPIDQSMKIVEGGTGWAVAMAQANNKEVHVFNLKDNSWYTWNGTQFVRSGVPTLAKNFAGIGSRQEKGTMTPQSIQAIRDVYAQTFGKSATVQPTASATQPTEVVFDKELNDKLKAKLQKLYPEIELKYTNDTIDEINDPDVFNQVNPEFYKNKDYELFRTLLGDYRKAIFQYTALSDKNKMALLTTAMSLISNNPVKYLSINTFNGVVGLDISRLSKDIYKELGEDVVSAKTKQEILGFKASMESTEGLDIKYAEYYEDAIKRENQRVDDIQKRLSKISNLESLSTKDLFKVLSTTNLSNDPIYEYYASFNINTQDGKPIKISFDKDKKINLSEVIKEKSGSFTLTSTRLLSSDEDLYIDARAAFDKFVNDRSRLLRAVEILVKTPLEKALTSQIFAPISEQQFYQEEIDMRWEVTQMNEYDILELGLEDQLRNVLLANGIIDEQYNMTEQFGFTPDGLLSATKNKEYTELKQKQEKIKYILNNKDKFDNDYDRYESQFGESDLLSPMPGWFLNAYSVSINGKYFDTLTNMGKLFVYTDATEAYEAQFTAGKTPKFQIIAEEKNLNNLLANGRINLNPKIDLTNKLYLLNQKERNRVIGQANIKAMTVLIDAVNQKQDTLPHEYAHHYIAWFRDTPIVQEAIKKWGSEEALVQAIGEEVVKQKGEAYTWWTRFVKWILNKLNSLSVLDKESLTKILTDAFLTRQDLSKIGQEGFGSDVREPVRKTGTMYFSYNTLQRPEVVASNTFDAIIAGQRTASTRYPQDSDADYWFDTEPGDIITWWSGAKTGQGKSVTVEVTSVAPVDFTQMSDQELENWSKLEGWGMQYARSKRTAKTRNKGIQIRFRVLPGDQARTLSGPSTDNLDNSDDFENNCQKPFLD